MSEQVNSNKFKDRIEKQVMLKFQQTLTSLHELLCLSSFASIKYRYIKESKHPLTTERH